MTYSGPRPRWAGGPIELGGDDARRFDVLFDYLTEDEEWFDWSAAMLGSAANAGSVAINPIVYAEISVR